MSILSIVRTALLLIIKEPLIDILNLTIIKTRNESCCGYVAIIITQDGKN
jgi:hypothetical protein